MEHGSVADEEVILPITFTQMASVQDLCQNMMRVAMYRGKVGQGGVV
jgi:hypothetical protein